MLKHWLLWWSLKLIKLLLLWNSKERINWFLRNSKSSRLLWLHHLYLRLSKPKIEVRKRLILVIHIHLLSTLTIKRSQIKRRRSMCWLINKRRRSWNLLSLVKWLLLWSCVEEVLRGRGLLCRRSKCLVLSKKRVI